MTAKRRTLIVEFALPTFYVDGAEAERIAAFAAEHEMDESEALLGDMGEIGFGLLTLELTGQKEGDIVTVPVMARSARIVDEPPREEAWFDTAREKLVDAVVRDRKYELRVAALAERPVSGGGSTR